MNDPEPLIEINVRAPRYFIMRVRGLCRQCDEPTDLFGLALPAGHETLDVDEDAEDCAPSAWILADRPSLIFRIEFMNAEVAARFASLKSSFRPGRQESAAGPAWTNHCESCGSSFDDEELFSEPEEPFLPINEAGASAIGLLAIDEPLEAAAGGYSLDPPFFNAMSRD